MRRPLPFLVDSPTRLTPAASAKESGFSEIPLALAPMAALSELPFRRLCLELGASWAPTELVSAEGLWRKQKKTLRYLSHDERAERPFVVQIFGHVPATMALAAQAAVDAGAGAIDLNMGCPAAKVVKGGSGAALMKTPELAAQITEAVRRAVPDGIPVTAKFRSGWDEGHINAVPFARLLESAGASALAVHARTRAQAYSGQADWRVIAAVREAVSIPVVGNGDVTSPELMRRMAEETHCDGVMIGRGAMGNPWIFRECRGGPPPTRAERGALIRRHLLEHIELSELGELAAIHAFRTQLACYAHGLFGAAEFRRAVMAIDELAALLDKIDAFFSDEARSEAEAIAEELGRPERERWEASSQALSASAPAPDAAIELHAPPAVPAVLTPEEPDDARFMAEALLEADAAASEGEIPIGAVAVFEGKVIARAHNRRERGKDPTAHAELLAIQAASAALGAWRLSGVTLYVTLEPCPMCAGALMLARVSRVVFGTSDPRAGAAGSLMNLLQDSRLNHRARLTRGVSEEACREKIQNFFRALRSKTR